MSKATGTPARTVAVACTVEIAQLPEALYAHVALVGLEVGPGDVVQVADAPPQVPYGTSACYARTATVARAGWTQRLRAVLRGYVELLSLCEIGFSGERLDAQGRCAPLDGRGAATVRLRTSPASLSLGTPESATP